MENSVGKILGAIMFLGVVSLTVANYVEQYKPAAAAVQSLDQRQTAQEQTTGDQQPNLTQPSSKKIQPNVQTDSIQPSHYSVDASANDDDDELEDEIDEED